MQRVTRRTFVLAGAVLAPAAAGVAAAGIFTPPMVAKPRHDASNQYRFFDEAEAGFIEAACERLVPADIHGIGACEAGVPHRLDSFLADDTTTTATWFRVALGATLRTVRARAGVSGSFAHWAAAHQIAFLEDLESGTLRLDGASSRHFFRTLLALTVDAYLHHPTHGPARDRFPWPVDGLAGMCAASFTERRLPIAARATRPPNPTAPAGWLAIRPG